MISTGITAPSAFFWIFLTQSSKIDLAGFSFQTKNNHFKHFNTKSRKWINISLSTLQHFFSECWNPRFSNKPEIAIQKYNHQDKIHTFPDVNTEDMPTDQTIRTRQSLIGSTRHYSKTRLWFISFVEASASMVQIYTFLFKSIQILLCTKLYYYN